MIVNSWQICTDCGAPFYRTGSRQIRCKSCQEKHTKKLNEERRKKAKELKETEHKRTPYTEKRKALTEKKIEMLHGDTVCHRKNCVYGMQFGGGVHCCGYILIVGRSRPCSVQNCTAYKTKRRRELNRIVINSEEYAERVRKGFFKPYKQEEFE